MILPQLAGGVLFPNDNVPESEKLKPEFGLRCARALYSRFCAGGTYFSFSQLPEMQETRNYGGGMQSSEKYKNWFTNGSPVGNKSISKGEAVSSTRGMTKAQRKAMTNISYEIFSPMRKLSNVILSILSDNDYKIKCVSLDKNIVNRKKRKKSEIYVKANFSNPLAKSLGLKEYDLPFVPKDEVMLDMAERLGFFKTKYEVALEKLAEAGFRASDWSHKRMLLNKDAIDFHFRCAKVYNDSLTGQVKVEYIDPTRLVMLWNEDNNDEPVAIGHIAVETIQSIYNKLIDAGFSEEQIQAMAKSYVPYQTDVSTVPQWAFERRDPTTNRWVWMDFKVYVLKFEYLSTDYKQYVERTNKQGYTSFLRNNNPVDQKKKNPNDTYEEVACNYWYEGSYIISGTGQDRIYEWKKKPNQMQKGLSPLSSYVVHRIPGQSPTRSVRGLLDDLMFAMLKLRAAVWAAAPKGYRIDVGEGANIKIGGVEYDIFDLVHVHRQNGIQIVATKFNAATGKYVSQPIQEMDNGLGPQGAEWIQQIATLQSMIMDVMGIPEAMAASPDQSAERLVGVMEQDFVAGNHANWPLRESERQFKQKVGERIIHQARIDIEFDPQIKDFYESVIGKNMIDALDEIQGLSLDQLAISAKVLPNDKERSAILQRAMQMSQIPTKDGSVLLRPSSVERIAQLLKNDDIDEALWYMATEEVEARNREEQYAMEAMKQNAQMQQQSAIASEEAKRQTAREITEMQIAVEREKANIELQKALQLQKMKQDANYELQLIKGQQIIDQISLEARMESEYGNEITGRV
jgi:hypothetical protein